MTYHIILIFHLFLSLFCWKWEFFMGMKLLQMGMFDIITLFGSKCEHEWGLNISMTQTFWGLVTVVASYYKTNVRKRQFLHTMDQFDNSCDNFSAGQLLLVIWRSSVLMLFWFGLLSHPLRQKTELKCILSSYRIWISCKKW